MSWLHDKCRTVPKRANPIKAIDRNTSRDERESETCSIPSPLPFCKHSLASRQNQSLMPSFLHISIRPFINGSPGSLYSKHHLNSFTCGESQHLFCWDLPPLGPRNLASLRTIHVLGVLIAQALIKDCINTNSVMSPRPHARCDHLPLCFRVANNEEAVRALCPYWFCSERASIWRFWVRVLVGHRVLERRARARENH